MIPPRIDDATRDAIALVLCALRDDQAGVNAIVNSCELVPLFQALGQLLVEQIRMQAVADGCHDDLIPHAIESALSGMLLAQA